LPRQAALDRGDGSETTVFLQEPPRTPYDLNFVVFGVPVRVHPLFWLGSAFFGFELARDDVFLLLLWMISVFVSILVHEMGHAFVIRAYGDQPWITLTMMGGLASAMRGRRTPREQFVISLAGPAAQILLAFFVIALVRASHHQYSFEIPFWPDSWPDLNGAENPPLRSRNLLYLTNFLVWPSIVWALLNLLPVLPLDGGQMARALLQMTGRRDAWELSLLLSVVTAVCAGIYGFKEKETFLMILFGVLAFDNYQQLQRSRGGW
jgi:stage IV sporulation protein FB